MDDDVTVSVGVPLGSLLDAVEQGMGWVCIDPSRAPAGSTGMVVVGEDGDDRDARPVGVLHRVGDPDAPEAPAGSVRFWVEWAPGVDVPDAARPAATMPA